MAFDVEDIDAFLRTPPQPRRALIEQLLRIYVAEGDWWQHITRLMSRFEKSLGKERGREKLNDVLSFTIIFPSIEPTLKIDEDSLGRNLFSWYKFYQYEEGQGTWAKKLQDVLRRDKEILVWRRDFIDMGIISPIHFLPYCRQAHSWLCSSVEESGITLTPEISKKFERLVMTYGGMSISYLYENRKNKIDALPNWRTAYFVERLLYETFGYEKLRTVKVKELQSIDNSYIQTIQKGAL